MTWMDLVKKYFPNASEKECDFILWEKTAFPLCDLETVERQLQEFNQSIGGILS